MSKPVLTIFYQFNPWQSSIGGILTVIRSFIKYAPDEFEGRVVGTGLPGATVGVWESTEYAGRSIEFMPVIALEEDNVRKLIPTTISYGAALIGRNLASDFMHFHRIEPTLASLNWAGDKTLFIHNDIRKQMERNSRTQEACVRTAQPYSAPTVVAEVYRQMLHRWQYRRAIPIASPYPN